MGFGSSLEGRGYCTRFGDSKVGEGAAETQEGMGSFRLRLLVVENCLAAPYSSVARELPGYDSSNPIVWEILRQEA